jgi:hypothetical protein
MEGAMKRSLATLWATMAVVGLLVTGCNKDNVVESTGDNPPAGVTDESSARASYATSDDFVQNDVQTIDDEDMQPTDYGTFGKINAAITPLRWGRFVTSVTTTIMRDSVASGDSIAVVRVHRVISGTLKIKGINGTGDTVVVSKPFTDNSDRNLIFKRVARETKRYWLNWLPVATSLVDGGTPSGEINITQVDLFTANDTLTVTDPLSYYLRYFWRAPYRYYRSNVDVPNIAAGAPVTIQVTVVSSSSDTDLVALRYGVAPLLHLKRRMRMQLVSETNNGDGTYTRVFETQFNMHFHRGFFHAAVDAATKATLFDDDPNQYAVSWWAVPYRVL